MATAHGTIIAVRRGIVGQCKQSPEKEAALPRRNLKPLVRAPRGPALVKRNVTNISRNLEEELFRAADVLSEGNCRSGVDGSNTYFGSTMIRFDLNRVRRHWQGRFDTAAARRLTETLQGSVRMHLRAMRIAYGEVARRVPYRPLGTARVETRVRLSDKHLHLDVDLEVPLGVSSVTDKRE